MRCEVTVDESGCISSGRCVANFPELFGFDAERKARALVAEADLAQEVAEEIMDGCPAGVIEITFAD